MKFTGLALAVLSLTILVGGPAFADVVPVRKSADKTAPVKDQLLSLGATPTTVEKHLASLTPGELAFFAKDANQVQIAGGLHAEEMFFGLAVIGIVVGIYFLKVSNHRGNGGR